MVGDIGMGSSTNLSLHLALRLTVSKIVSQESATIEHYASYSIHANHMVM